MSREEPLFPRVIAPSTIGSMATMLLATVLLSPRRPTRSVRKLFWIPWVIGLPAMESGLVSSEVSACSPDPLLISLLKPVEMLLVIDCRTSFCFSFASPSMFDRSGAACCLMMLVRSIVF